MLVELRSRISAPIRNRARARTRKDFFTISLLKLAHYGLQTKSSQADNDGMHAALLAAVAFVHSTAVKREARAATVLFLRLNEERRRIGAPRLALDPQLSDAAAEHVADMARNHYFDHVSPAGISPFDRMRRHGCSFSSAAENIALASTPQQADLALYNSTPHRENSLNGTYRRVGIAVIISGDGRLLFVEDFSD